MQAPVHITVAVHADSLIWAGVSGGVVVLVGVIATEVLLRFRERRRRLDDAWYKLRAITSPIMVGNPYGLTHQELSARYSDFLRQLSRVRGSARFPVRNAKKIREECDEVLTRIMIATGHWAAKTAGPPRLGPVMGDKLATFVSVQKPEVIEKINARLKAEGLATIDAQTADMSLNESLPSQKPPGR